MNTCTKILLALLVSAMGNYTLQASMGNLIGNAMGQVLVPLLCAPSKERLETQEVYKEGDLVKVVHGSNVGAKGKIVGSFFEVKGKENPQDVLAELKKNDDHVCTFLMSLMPMKDRAFLNTKPPEGCKEVDLMGALLAKKPELLDPRRLYKIKFKPNDELEARAGFEYEHVACLKKIEQEKFDHDSDSDDDLSDLKDTDYDLDEDDSDGCVMQ